jgi:hypothetical protein
MKKKQRKLRIKKVSSRSLVDFAGMNRLAARKLGYKMPKNTDIVVARGMSKRKTGRVIKHEQSEMSDMKKGDSYFAAHRKADRKYPAGENRISGRQRSGRR